MSVIGMESSSRVTTTAPTPAGSAGTRTSQPAYTSWCLVMAAMLTGLALVVQASYRCSATYDEAAYLRVASRWWRTGDQSEITRMGSPLLFWKLQQAPVLWALDRTGHGGWIDDPAGHERELLPLVRVSSSWLWLLAFGLTAAWSGRSYGPRAMALAAWIFALWAIGPSSMLRRSAPRTSSSRSRFPLACYQGRCSRYL